MSQSRKNIIAGNWKLHKSIQESIELATLIKRENLDEDSPTVVICPVYTALSDVAEVCNESPIHVGAQDLYWENQGAFTGEVSAPLLKDAGCEYVVIGHSERRQFFGETDEWVNKKIQAAIQAGLKPIVCCGEKLEERESGNTNSVLDKQIRGAFDGLNSDIASRCVIAYEPVWAIGTGKVATTEQAQEAHAFIRGLISELYDAAISNACQILYGGSVKPANAADLIKQSDVDGALVGGASLDADSFVQIIRAAAEVKVS